MFGVLYVRHVPPSAHPGMLVMPPNGASANVDTSAPVSRVILRLALRRITPAPNRPPKSPKSTKLGLTVSVIVVSDSCADICPKGSTRPNANATEWKRDTDP